MVVIFLKSSKNPENVWNHVKDDCEFFFPKSEQTFFFLKAHNFFLEMLKIKSFFWKPIFFQSYHF